MGFDPITLSLAKAYSDSQRIGYSAYEVTTSIYFDGDISDKETIPGDALGITGTFVYASDVIATGGTVQEIVLKSGTKENRFKPSRIEVTTDGTWLAFGLVFNEEKLLALSFGLEIAQMLGVSPGTYVWTFTDGHSFFYINYIFGYITETIHPIDPKFIPGAVLIEMPYTTNTVTISADAVEKIMERAINNLIPFSIRVATPGGIIYYAEPSSYALQDNAVMGFTILNGVIATATVIIEEDGTGTVTYTTN